MKTAENVNPFPDHLSVLMNARFIFPGLPRTEVQVKVGNNP